MKKFRSVLLIILSILVLTACSQDVDVKEEDVSVEGDLKTEIRVGSLKGPTTIGLAHLIDEGRDAYVSEIYPLAEEIVVRLNKEELDLAVVPANLASTLYNKTDGKIQVLATNNLGVLHLIENGNAIKSLEDLNGKTVWTVGKGTTPDAILNYLRDELDLDFQIEFKSEASEIGKMLATEDGIIACLPEPFVSVLESKNEEIRRFADLNEEWERINDGEPIVTGVLVGRRDFIAENEEAISEFLKDYRESIDYARGSMENKERVLKIAEELAIIPEGLKTEVIDNCNLYFSQGEEMEDLIEDYLDILEDFNPEIIGGKEPKDDFYKKIR